MTRAGLLTLAAGLLIGVLLLVVQVVPAPDDRPARLSWSQRTRVNRLVEQLQTRQPSTWKPAAEELIAMGPAVAEDVVPLLRSGRGDRAGLHVLTAMASDAHVQQVLSDALGSSNVNVRHCAAIVLGKSGNRSHVPSIAPLVKRHPAAAGGALAELGGDEALDALVEGLKAVEPQSRWLVANNVGRLGRSEAIPHLEEALRHIDAQYPPISATAMVEAIRKIQKINGIETPKPIDILYEFSLGLPDRYPRGRSMAVYDVAKGVGRHVSRPRVDPANEQGRKAFLQAILDSGKGNLAIDFPAGDRLLTFRGLLLAPVKVETEPPHHYWTDAAKKLHPHDLAERVRAYNASEEAAQGPVPGMRAYPFGSSDSFAALLGDGRVVMMRVRPVKSSEGDFDCVQIVIDYRDPLYALVGLDTRTSPDPGATEEKRDDTAPPAERPPKASPEKQAFLDSAGSAEPAKPHPLDFHGIDLAKAPVTTAHERLSDLFEERPPGSKSYELRRDVLSVYSDVDGSVYYAPQKKVFFVQSDPPGSSTLHYYGPLKSDSPEILALDSLFDTEGGAIVDRGDRLRHARLALEATKRDRDRALEVNRRVPGTVPASKFERLEFEHRLAQLKVRRAELAGKDDRAARREIDVQCAKLAAQIAKAEHERALAMNRRVPGEVPASEVKRLESERRLAQLKAQQAELADDEVARREIDVQCARIVAERAAGEYQRAVAVNQRMPGSIPGGELQRLTLTLRQAQLDVVRKIAARDRAAAASPEDSP